MAKNTTPVFTNSMTMAGTTFANADGAGDTTGTNSKQVAAGAANDSRLYKINITSDDTSARDMLFYLYNGATKYLLGAVSVPIGAGKSSAALSVDLLASGVVPISYDQNGNPFLRLKSGWYLYAAAGVAITAAKTITVITVTEDY